MKDNNILPSKYTLRFSVELDRIAIVEKENGNVLESYSNAIVDSFITLRMQEIREDEIFRDRITKGTTLDTSNGGIITDFNVNQVTSGDIIV